MFQSKVPPFFKANCAGKVFILGEYAVLANLPAIVAAIPPRFVLSAYEGAHEGADLFPEYSPAGRLVAWARELGLPELSFCFGDPHRETGGFGASTAQFALAYYAYAQKNHSLSNHWSRVWDLYRELMDRPVEGRSTPLPSGADLVAQWQGGVVFFDPAERNCLDVWPLFDWSNLLCFSATGQIGRKVPTHRHLEDLAQRGFPSHDVSLVSFFEEKLQEGVEAIRANDGTRLGRVMNAYGDALWNAGLECEATDEDRQILRNQEGVLGVKGAGALQSDAILVLMAPSAEPKIRNSVIQIASDRGLKLVSDGFDCQMGVAGQGTAEQLSPRQAESMQNAAKQDRINDDKEGKKR